MNNADQLAVLTVATLSSLLFFNLSYNKAQEQQTEQFKKDLKETNNFIKQGIGERLKMIGRKEYLEGRL